MGVVSNITSSDILSIDTNILINAFNKDSASLGLLEKIRDVSPKVVISVLVFEEFLVKVYKEKLEKDIAKYEEFITGGNSFTVVDFNRQIAREAAKIRARYKLRAPDAIHIATALKSSAKMFITADKRIPRKIDSLQIMNI